MRIQGAEIKYSERCVVIKDCYRVKDRGMREILEEFKRMTGYKSKRSTRSWIREWKAHKRLYKLGIARSHTKDCDLEEEIKWWLEIVYMLVGF